MSSVADVLALVAARTEARVACTHCGLDVPDGARDQSAPRQFCCSGCRTAYSILQDGGLARYYEFSERREAPVRATGRTYEEFDHPTFADLYVKRLQGGLAQVELYLEGVHCASCVWLVERVPIVLRGVHGAELDIRRSLARVTWDPSTVPLSSVARMLDSLGYPPHPFRGVARDEMRRREDRAMLIRIGVAGAIMINVMLAALALYSGWLGGMDAQFTAFFRWISFALVTPAMFWPGRVFFVGAWSALRARTLHMDVPIALGLAAGYVQGAHNTIRGDGPVYFDGLATLIFALLVGRYLQQRGQRSAADSAELVFSLTPTTAHVVESSGDARDIPAQAIVPGMSLEVRAGETFAADGVVIGGQTSVDMSLLTGESAPVPAAENDRVYAGTVNIASPVVVRVEQAGEASRVAKILRQVEEGGARRAPVIALANKMSGYFVAGVLIVAFAAWLAWRFIDPTRAVDVAVAVLIVTCPCALALSTPLAISTAIGRAARSGMLVKAGDALERLGRAPESVVRQLFLDKTGTITEARAALVEWTGPDWVKPIVLALERGSTHPIAAAFRNAWPDEVIPNAACQMHVVGGGIEGLVAGQRVVIGSPGFVSDRVSVAPDVVVGAEPLTPVWVAVDDVVVARAGIGDPIRADAAGAVAALRAQGWHVRIVSGDAPAAVRSVGASLGIADDDCIGGMSPEGKLAMVEDARSKGVVVMVGDGINDAAAIAAASVGIGAHGGAEACLASSDVYLTEPGLTPLVRLVDGARRTFRVIERNVAFSIIYNLIGAGLAVTGHLTPLVAAILMPASSLTVVLASRAPTFRRDS
jgi:Cu2+-exporting ATPase